MPAKKKVEHYKGFNLHDFAGKAERIYESHREELEEQYLGKIIAIEVDSGDYFISQSMDAVSKKAERKHPHKYLHYMRIGGGGVFKFRGPVFEMPN